MKYSFKSTGKFSMDIGTVYSTLAPHEYKRDECPFLFKDVLIDGKEHHVYGVESFAVCPTRAGSDIALLVKKRTPGKAAEGSQ